jgi:uncharacterized membrane protein
VVVRRWWPNFIPVLRARAIFMLWAPTAPSGYRQFQKNVVHTVIPKQSVLYVDRDCSQFVVYWALYYVVVILSSQSWMKWSVLLQPTVRDLCMLQTWIYTPKKSKIFFIKIASCLCFSIGHKKGKAIPVPGHGGP